MSFVQLTSLVTLGLLSQIGSSDPLESPKYKCLVSLDFVKSISRSVFSLYSCHAMIMAALHSYITGCLGGAAVRHRTRDRKVAGSTPGQVNQVNSAFHPSGVGKSSTCLHGWG